MSGLYHEGAFIKASVAKALAMKGLSFLRKYAELALLCHRQGMKRFPFIPKCHYLHHQILQLFHESRSSQWARNLLLYGCQMQEDYVGRPSRLARRVSSRTQSLRVIQRIFLAIRSLGFDEFGVYTGEKDS